MGKKIDTAKPLTAIAEKPASRTNTAKTEAAAPPSIRGDGAPAKAGAKKKVAEPAPKKTAGKKPEAFSTDEIALRAYFISEHRQRQGIHGDEHSDWIEAERQLKAESQKKTAKKPAQLRKRA